MNIEVIKNILDNKTIKDLTSHMDKVYQNREDLVFNNNLSLWNQDIIEYSNEVLIYNLDTRNKLFSSISKDLFKLNINKSIKSILYYYWLPGSYIPWHTDKHYSYTLTIYLNDIWDLQWGGLFQYCLNDCVNSITPVHNLGILQQGDINHSTTITTKASPIRRTLQIFFSDKDLNYEII